jgi:hypothetical protein
MVCMIISQNCDLLIYREFIAFLRFVFSSFVHDLHVPLQVAWCDDGERSCGTSGNENARLVCRSFGCFFGARAINWPELGVII